MANTHFVLLLLLTLTYGSMLPRLIHAAVADVTNSNDVKGLAALQRSYIVLTFSTGDPCFGLVGPWSWIQCSTDSPARVTALNLMSAGLMGPLPDFSSMDALKTIDFSSNYVTGPIPAFLGTLPHLTTLDLSYNDLSGTIPASILNNKNLVTYIAGNPKLSTPKDNSTPSSSNTDQPLYNTSGSKKKSNTGTIVGVVSAVVIIVSIVVGVFAIMNHNKRKAAAVAAANSAAAAGNGGVAAKI